MLYQKTKSINMKHILFRAGCNVMNASGFITVALRFCSMCSVSAESAKLHFHVRTNSKKPTTSFFAYFSMDASRPPYATIFQCNNGIFPRIF